VESPISRQSLSSMPGLSHRITGDSSSLPFRCAYSPRNKDLAAGLNASWYQPSTNGIRITLIPFHYRARTAPTDRAAGLLRSIPAASCSPNLHRPAKCDTTTPCRTESKASATRHWTRAAPGYRPRSRPLQAAYCTRRHERRFAKRIRPRIASQRQGGYVRPEAHLQAGQ
jgi:hypothetical protein